MKPVLDRQEASDLIDQAKVLASVFETTSHNGELDCFSVHTDALAILDPRASQLFRLLCSKHGTKSFFFVVLDPDPFDYYTKHFEWMPVFEFQESLSQQEYLSVLCNDPGNSPADAIMYRADLFVIFPKDEQWSVVGDRESDSALITSGLTMSRGDLPAWMTETAS